MSQIDIFILVGLTAVALWTSYLVSNMNSKKDSMKDWERTREWGDKSHEEMKQYYQEKKKEE